MNGGSTSNRTPPHRQLPRMLLLIHDSTLNFSTTQPSPRSGYTQVATSRGFSAANFRIAGAATLSILAKCVLTLVLRFQTRLAHRTNRGQLICFWVTAALSLVELTFTAKLKDSACFQIRARRNFRDRTLEQNAHESQYSLQITSRCKCSLVQ
jgi:hypothetical protein